MKYGSGSWPCSPLSATSHVSSDDEESVLCELNHALLPRVVDKNGNRLQI